ncbi:hypothetical protein GGR51DRAFT_569955 [Nemania sp. FL0031]|nr:hypothetical protein GGR51DRAFT_569955 [Nemania sp. FL0031]
MHDYSLPEVDPVINVENDYGTPNLLFFYDIPLVTEGMNNELASIQDDFRSWNAWELCVAEDQLQMQLEKGNLPLDDSFESRVKRTNYRAKVVGILRDTSEGAWLLHDQSTSTQFFQSVKKVDVNSLIRKVLRDHYLKGQPSSHVAIMLSIVGNIGAADPSAMHKYDHTTSSYEINKDRKDIESETRVSSFAITQTPDDADKDAVMLKVDFLDSFICLDREAWRSFRGQVEDMIQDGTIILNEMALDFFVAKQGH